MNLRMRIADTRDTCAWSRTTHSAAETRTLGARLAKRLKPGDVVLLWGDLGSGKTTLAQGICHGLEVVAWANSPTFTLINEYDGRLADGRPVRVYHCDFYRLRDSDELNTLALDEVFYGDGVALVEWPKIAEEWLPQEAIRVHLTRLGPHKRQIDIMKLIGQTEEDRCSTRMA